KKAWVWFHHNRSVRHRSSAGRQRYGGHEGHIKDVTQGAAAAGRPSAHRLWQLRHLELAVGAWTEVLGVVAAGSLDLEHRLAAPTDAIEDQEVLAVGVGRNEGKLDCCRDREAAQRDGTGAVQRRVLVLVALELELAVHVPGLVDHDPAPDTTDAERVARAGDAGDRVLAVQ